MLTSASARTAAVVVLAAFIPLTTSAPASADDDPKPVCIESICTGKVKTNPNPPPPPSPPPTLGPAPLNAPSQLSRPGGPAAQYDVGLPAQVRPVAPTGPVPGQLWDDAGVAANGPQCDLVPAVTCPDAPVPAPAPAVAGQPVAVPVGQSQARAPRPDPVAVAQQSVATLKMKPITPGTTPLEPGSMSIVGIPTWMWAENPSTATTGPITRTARVPGLSLTMTAKMTGVTWDMGDGTTVECAGTGTKWSPDLGTGDSPDCGHTYMKQGTYTVTSTSHWSVSWRASTGETGVIDRDLPSTSRSMWARYRSSTARARGSRDGGSG